MFISSILPRPASGVQSPGPLLSQLGPPPPLAVTVQPKHVPVWCGKAVSVPALPVRCVLVRIGVHPRLVLSVLAGPLIRSEWESGHAVIASSGSDALPLKLEQHRLYRRVGTSSGLRCRDCAARRRLIQLLKLFAMKGAHKMPVPRCTVFIVIISAGASLIAAPGHRCRCLAASASPLYAPFASSQSKSQSRSRPA